MAITVVAIPTQVPTKRTSFCGHGDSADTDAVRWSDDDFWVEAHHDKVDGNDGDALGAALMMTHQ